MKRIILTNEAPERLDKALSEQLSLSRSKIQKLIKDGQVVVDDQTVPVKFPVTAANRIEIDLPEPKQASSLPIPSLDILYEDDDVIVVNKPAGLLMHQTETSHEPTLVDALIAHDPAIADIGDKAERAGLVHRLDKYASGVIIAAKTPKAFNYLKKQFKDRNVEKRYTVLVHGTMEEPAGTITLTIGRAKNTGRMAARPVSQGGKEAITHYDVLEQFPHHALLDVRIETGRTHQIRAHFFALKHPVVGDTIYKQRLQKLLDIGRLFLHARALTITLPSGEEKTFSAPLPTELEEVLANLPK